jgi:hypothetical protein
MTPVPFDTDRDLAPIPFDDRICQLALKLKSSGLEWRPHVGCFVWDPDGVIQAPSPFPNRIYFILSLPRFLEIFGTLDRMIEKLVWLPTWHQARILCRHLGLRGKEPDPDLHALYERIGAAIELKKQNESFCDLAFQSELGDPSDLPPDLLARVKLVYREFVPAYLDMLRQKERKPADWFPDRWRLDLDLVDDMRHFFSDQQFITRKFLMLNAGIRQLREIDRGRQPDRFRSAVDELLQKKKRNILAEI